MSRPRKYTLHADEDIPLPTTLEGRSPLRRTPCKHPAQHKSPFRSRTPTRPLSPLRHLPINIRYIANVSPLAERPPEAENLHDLSNGKSIRYIQGSKADRNDRNFETNRKGEFNKFSDRNFPEDNRLFGKMVDKLNSEKKGQPGSQNSHKTSFFADTDAKPKVDPSLRPSGTFKQLVSLAKAGETRSDIKPRGREEGEEENLSCLVYRVRNPKEEQRQPVQINNHCSPAVRRKPSQAEKVLLQSCDEYRELDVLLGKIEGTKYRQAESGKEECLVRGSLSVRESLSMDPFL